MFVRRQHFRRSLRQVRTKRFVVGREVLCGYLKGRSRGRHRLPVTCPPQQQVRASLFTLQSFVFFLFNGLTLLNLIIICNNNNNMKQGVALTGRNTTGPPCSRSAIIRLEAAWRHRQACADEAACRPAVECYRRRQTPATGSLPPPYIMCRRSSTTVSNAGV